MTVTAGLGSPSVREGQGMANPAKGEFTIPINGTSYRFKVGTAALCAAQEEIGRQFDGRIPTLDAMMAGVVGLRLKFVRVFIWAALNKYHPEVAIGDVDDLIDAIEQDDVTSLIRGLTGTTLPDPRDKQALEGDGKKKSRPRKAQTKTTPLSGPDGSTTTGAASA